MIQRARVASPWMEGCVTLDGFSLSWLRSESKTNQPIKGNIVL